MKRILLVCAAGMSTSLLVTKMQKSAQEQGVEVFIEALSEAAAKDKIGNYNVVLLGPQVRFMEGKIKELAKPYNIPVAVINMMHYGMMNGKEVLAQALGLMG
ncbi:MAG: PTS sugar transporter subunit IIB [Fusobacteria bacterium]|nr:PTS sugar transporter subunit IIB [Fusobacteriota bacterium]